MKALINGVPFTFTEKLTVLEAVRKTWIFCSDSLCLPDTGKVLPVPAVYAS